MSVPEQQLENYGNLSRDEFTEAFEAQFSETEGADTDENTEADDTAEALAASETGADPEPGESEAGGDPNQEAAPETISDLAERLGVEVKDLYGIKVPMADGSESKTVGELKDLMANESELENRKLEWEEQRTQAENELVRAKQDLRTLIQSLPEGSVTQEKLAEAHRQTEEYRAQETKRLTDAIPEWRDEDRKAADREGIVEHMKEYGFTAAQFDSLMDHRMVKYVRDNWLRYKRVQDAISKVKAKPSKTPAASKPAPSKPKRGKAGPQSSRSEQVAAVAELLNEG